MKKDYTIVNATEKDRPELLSLYAAQKGREYCAWTEDYPSNETIDEDLQRNGLFVLKEDGIIKAAISIEEDEDVDRLECWDENLKPEGELARLCVLPEEQNKGFGRIMMRYGMEELQRRGFKGIHIIVNRENIKAIRCYEVFKYHKVGECHMYDQDFLCYEKEF